MSVANGIRERAQGSSLPQYVGGPILQKILLLKLGDIGKGTVQKKFWSMKKT